MLTSTGIPSKEDILSVTPPEERLAKGPCVMIECYQKIPCNPCTAACPRKAISTGDDINNTPEVNYDLCTGCGICIAHCPGLAIFVVDKTFAKDTAIVKVPFEYLPVPHEGQYACGLDREGKELGWFRVHRVTSGGRLNMTYTVALEVPQELAMEVRGIRNEGGYRDGK